METIFKQTGSLLHCETVTFENYKTDTTNTQLADGLFLPEDDLVSKTTCVFYFLNFLNLVNRNYITAWSLCQDLLKRAIYDFNVLLYA